MKKFKVLTVIYRRISNVYLKIQDKLVKKTGQYRTKNEEWQKYRTYRTFGRSVILCLNEKVFLIGLPFSPSTQREEPFLPHKKVLILIEKTTYMGYIVK